MNTLTLKKSHLPFNLDLTFSCGQIFGWKKKDDTWSGVHAGQIISIRQKNDRLEYAGIDEDGLVRFLGLQDDVSSIIQSIEKHIITYSQMPDSFFTEQCERARGLRILRQNPWECLVSFICSANSNVQTIGKRINLILDRYGAAYAEGQNSFPDAAVLAQCKEHELRECLTGYRAPYLIKTAQYLAEHPDFFADITRVEYSQAKSTLMILSGVGPKVADCVLLFAFERMEAVPVDTRIRAIIESRYAENIKPQKTGSYSYDDIANFCRDYFGPYAGYAQQFLFATRDA